MDKSDLVTSEELRKLQSAHPDDSISVSPYEDTSPQEAAKIVEILESKQGRMDVAEQAQYEAMQKIADAGGVLPSDIKPGNGPFKNDQDMMKKEGE